MSLFKNILIGPSVHAENTTSGPMTEAESINNTQINTAQQDLINKYTIEYKGFFQSIENNKPMCRRGIPYSPIECSQITTAELTTKNCSDKKIGEVATVWKSTAGFSAGDKTSLGLTENRGCLCPQGYVKNENGNYKNECLVNNAGNLGIDCNPTQLANGTCTRNINKTLGIRESAGSQPVTPTMFIQDIVLTATGFVGTVMMIALLVMGGKYVMGGFDESSTGDLKANMKKLLIGLLLIISSYTVIKIIQYIARGY